MYFSTNNSILAKKVGKAKWHVDSVFLVLNLVKSMVNKVARFWSKFDKTDKILIFLLIFSFFVRISFLFDYSVRGWDETVYLNLGQDLSENPLIYSLENSGWSDFIPSDDEVYGWPNIGFRAPLLPIFFMILKWLNLEMLIDFVVPFFSTLSILLVYFLGSKLFDKKVGLYSATLFSLVPLHILHSSKTLTDVFVVFFILLTFWSFWKGYEEGYKKHKVLFGLFLALSIYARYTAMWIAPVFLLYFLFRDKSFKFLKEKLLWVSIGVFFLMFIPWFVYGFLYYGHPLGAFIHGFKASTYWGGVQSWNFFFIKHFSIFSFVGILSLISLAFLIFKREVFKKPVILTLIWAIFFLFMIILMPHKEERFIMPVIPAVSLVCGLFISKIGKYKNIVFVIVCATLFFSLFNLFKVEYENSTVEANFCFLKGGNLLSGDVVGQGDVVITSLPPIVHFYSQKSVDFFGEPWSLENFRSDMNYKYFDREIFMFFTNYDMSTESKLKEDLDLNFNKVFECREGLGYSAVYEYK